MKEWKKETRFSIHKKRNPKNPQRDWNRPNIGGGRKSPHSWSESTRNTRRGETPSWGRNKLTSFNGEISCFSLSCWVVARAGRRRKLKGYLDGTHFLSWPVGMPMTCRPLTLLLNWNPIFSFLFLVSASCVYDTHSVSRVCVCSPDSSAVTLNNNNERGTEKSFFFYFFVFFFSGWPLLWQALMSLMEFGRHHQPAIPPPPHFDSFSYFFSSSLESWIFI